MHSISRRVLSAFTVCTALLCAGAAQAAPGVPDSRLLANGLRVVLLEDHTLPVLSVSLWVGAGSKDEIENSAGYAHFLEHLIQRGSDQGGPYELTRRAYRWGGSLSVRSNYDRTSISINGTPAVLDDMLAGVAAMAFHATLKDADIDRELGPLTQEIKAYYDLPPSVAFLETMRAAFPEHPYRVPMLGNFKTLGTLHSGPLLAFYQSLYVPNNMALAIAGDFDPKTIVAKVEAAFGPPPRSATLKTHEEPPPAFAGHSDIEKRLDFRDNWTTLSFVGPGYRHPDRPAFEAIAALLGDPSSTLQPALLKDQAGTLAQVSYYGLEEAGLLYVAINPATSELSYLAAATALREIASLKKNGIPAPALANLVGRMQREERLRATTMSERAERLGEATLFGGARYYWDRPAALARLTPADIARVAQKYLVAENMRLVVLMPKETPVLPDTGEKSFHEALDSLGAAGEGAGPGLMADAYPPAEATRVDPNSWGDPRGSSGLGDASRQVLKNGLTLVVIEDHRQPLAAVSLHLKAGSGSDPAGREGVAGMALRLLASRTSQRAQEITATAPRRLTIVPEAQVTRDFLEIRFAGPISEIETGLSALAWSLQQPLPGTADPEVARQAALASLQRAERDPDSVALDLFYEKVYAGSSYAHPPDGIAAGLQAVTAADLAAFGERAARPEGAVLAVAGDVSAKEIARLADRLLGAWGGRAAGSPSSRDAAAAGGAVPVIKATAGALPGDYSRQIPSAQSRVLIGSPIVTVTDADFRDLRLLGAGVTLLAFDDMVFTRRAAFSVVAIPEALGRGGSLAFEVIAAHPRRSEAQFDLSRFLRQVATEELGADERRDAARMLAGRAATAAQGPLPIASSLAYREASGLGARSWRDDFALTPPDGARLKSLAGRYLNPEGWISVVVGPPAP